MIISSIVFIVFFISIFFNVPIYIALIAGSFSGLIVWGRIPFQLIPQRMFSGIDEFVLIAIPFFILTGMVMEKSGLAKKLLSFSSIIVGQIRGGLAIVNVIGSMFFAGITGAASADTASVGAILIPAMTNKGYDADYAVCVTITSSTIGVIIPPSIPMIIYAVLASVSIAQLFAAGLIPGILIGLALIGVSVVIAIRHDYPKEKKLSLKSKIKYFFQGVPALIVIIIIFGGIFGGVFTPTEASVVAATYSLFMGIVILRTIKIKDLPSIFCKTAIMTSLVGTLIGTSNIFSWILASQQVPLTIRNYILSTNLTNIQTLLVIALIYLIIGCFIDLTPAMIILVPIFLPTILSMGIDPIHFGIITIMALAIGLYTPPVGVCLAVGLAISKEPIERVTKRLIPFFVVMVLILVLVIIFPKLTLFMVQFVK